MFADTLAIIEDEEQRNELAVFYSKYKDRLYSIALSNLHDEIDAEDAIQEAFSRIADKPEKFFGVLPNRRLGYISGMVKKISVNMFNAKNKLSKESLEELDEKNESAPVDLENALFDEIGHNEVMLFVNKLPRMRRSVLILHCLYDLSIDETAQRLDISISTANKHLTLARKAVRAFIDERKNSL